MKKRKRKHKTKRKTIAEITRLRALEKPFEDEEFRNPPAKSKKHKQKDKRQSVEELRDKLKNCPVLIPQAAIDKLRELPTPHNSNCLVLYVFYLRKAIRDGTPSIWCDNSYVVRGLRWSPGKVKRTRKYLSELGYIKTKKAKDKSGHFSGAYVVLKYYPSIKTIERSECLAELNRFFTELGSVRAELSEVQKEAELIMAELDKMKKQSAGGTKMIPPAEGTKMIPPDTAEGTKTRPVVKSTPITYSTPSRKTYNTQSPASRGSERVVDDSLFDDDKDRLNKFKLRNSFEYKSSIKLAQAVKSPKAKRLHPIQRKANLLEWSKEFRELHVKDGIKEDTIDYILTWYCEHIGEEHIPEAFCGESFREKFGQIVSAMVRAGDFDKEDCGQIGSEDDEDAFDEVQTVLPETKTFTTKKGLKVTRTFKDAYDGALKCKDVWIDSEGEKRALGRILEPGEDPYEFDDDKYDDYEPPESDED